MLRDASRFVAVWSLSLQPVSLSSVFGCFGVFLIATNSQQPKHELVIMKTNGKKWAVPTQGADCDSWWVGGAWGWVSMGWGCGVISQSCSAAHLRVDCADLGHAGSLSKYLHANWCYLIQLSVMRFQKFKNWRRRGSLVALSWQFDSDFIIRAWFYNKQELSCLIRHARRCSPPPPPPPHLAPPLVPPSNSSLSESRRAKLPTFTILSLLRCVCSAGAGGELFHRLNPLTASWSQLITLTHFLTGEMVWVISVMRWVYRTVCKTSSCPCLAPYVVDYFHLRINTQVMQCLGFYSFNCDQIYVIKTWLYCRDIIPDATVARSECSLFGVVGRNTSLLSLVFSVFSQDFFLNIKDMK